MYVLCVCYCKESCTIKLFIRMLLPLEPWVGMLSTVKLWICILFKELVLDGTIVVVTSLVADSRMGNEFDFFLIWRPFLLVRYG